MVEAFNYLRGYHRIKDEVDEAIQRVFASGQLILGPEVGGFEEEFAAYVGAEEAVGVASGTDALVLALRAVGVSRGDLVATVANTAVATVAAIRAVDATPQFVDVCGDTLLMDPSALARAAGPETRAVIPVHLYGQPAPMQPILDIARRHGMAVIEDCSQAHGAQWRGQHVGTFGDVGCFSLYPTKPLGAFGDAGVCVTNRPDLASEIRRQRMYGFDSARPVAMVEGLNSRLDELQAAVLRVKLRRLDAALESRRTIARRYSAALRGQSVVRTVAEVEDARHSHYVYVVRSAARDQLCEALRSAGIGFGIHYPVPIHRMPAYQFVDCKQGDLPATETASDEVLSLPIFPELEEHEIQTVVDFLAAADDLQLEAGK